MSWGTVELEPEVQDWLEQLPTAQFATAAFYVDLLAEQGPLLGEPYTRQLDGKLRELRFHFDGNAVRVTYWIASGRRIVFADGVPQGADEGGAGDHPSLASMATVYGRGPYGRRAGREDERWLNAAVGVNSVTNGCPNLEPSKPMRPPGSPTNWAG
jgi:hypothetical protein